MNEERYPATLLVTLADFNCCAWRDVLVSCKRDGYSSMWQSFSDAARQGMLDGLQSEAKVLWLLADACSMRLTPKSFNEPYQPIFVVDAKRSVIPDDFSESDITFLAAIVDEVDDNWLKARLADIVWLKQRPRDPKFALTAIDAYRTIPLNTEDWISDGQECWERAFSLARMLRAGAGSRFDDMSATVVHALIGSSAADGFLALWLSDLLAVNGAAHEHGTTISQKLEFLAHEFQTKGDLQQAREFFRAASKWFKICKDDA